jgi:hypothetical protein
MDLVLIPHKAGMTKKKKREKTEKKSPLVKVVLWFNTKPHQVPTPLCHRKIMLSCVCGEVS